ncbi:hypothetical protein Baya_17075 [Bagarius yarrelli]|uniref:Uncharacterized protein n=1 Tax=Bagarius yarrelli TaxID=175774 RepID=A0A556VXE3_BAGYA|nr:hypothetical protein Baya_17075 [Bagarius yarrelli]
MVQNYKQASGVCSPSSTDEFLTPAHEENVRFIHYSQELILILILILISLDRTLLQ